MFLEGEGEGCVTGVGRSMGIIASSYGCLFVTCVGLQPEEKVTCIALHGWRGGGGG